MVVGMVSKEVPDVSMSEETTTKEVPLYNANDTYAHVYLGYAKLVEELGELQTELGKLIPFPFEEHPDGKGPILERILQEIADVQAAITYFLTKNEFQISQERVKSKLQFFNNIGLSGIIVAINEDELEQAHKELPPDTNHILGE